MEEQLFDGNAQRRIIVTRMEDSFEGQLRSVHQKAAKEVRQPIRREAGKRTAL